MEMSLVSVYGRYVWWLQGVQAFIAACGRDRWFSTQEEARQAALDWHKKKVLGYGRECPGKRLHREAVAYLESVAPRQIPDVAILDS